MINPLVSNARRDLFALLGKMMDIIGRKKGLILSQVISLTGWIIVCAAFDVWIICIGRFICGIAAASTALIGDNPF